MKQLKPYLQIIIAFTFLILLYKSRLLQLDKIQLALNNPTILFSGLILFILQFLIFALRWQLVSGLVSQTSFAFSLKSHLIGQFFNTFVPGGVGGDVMKALELSKKNKLEKVKAIALTLVDRVSGLYCMIIFSFFFLLIEFQKLDSLTLKYLTSASFLFLASSLCLIFRNAVFKLFMKLTYNIKNNFLNNLKKTISYFFEILNLLFKQKNFVSFFSLSLVAQLFSILFLYIVVQFTSSSQISFILFFPMACFAFMAMAVPLTPGGIGFGQAAFYFIFKSVDETTANAAIVGISLIQIFYILLSLPGGYYFLKSLRTKSVDN